MSDRPFIPFDDIREIAIFACYVAAVDNGEDRVNGPVLSKILNNIIAPNIIVRHFEALHKEAFLGLSESGFRRVHSKLIKLVEAKIVSKETPFYDLYVNGADWLKARYGRYQDMTVIHPNIDIPASDRVVSIADNGEAIDSIKNDVAGMRNVIRENNEVGDALEDAREIIDLELEIAEEVLARPRFRLRSLLAWLIPALTFLADKFAGGAIGELAKRLIANLLGLQ